MPTKNYKEYYANKGFEVQKARIINALKKIASGDLSARKPSLKTLIKYGLYDDTTKKVTLPEKAVAPQVIFTEVPSPPDPQVIQIVRQTQAPLQRYNPATATVTGKDIRDWVYTELSARKMKTGKERSKKTRDMYANTPRNLFLIRGETYDENKNIAPYFLDATTNIAKINDYDNWKQAGSKAKPLSAILFLLQEYPQLKEIASEDLIKTYDAEYKRLSNKAKAEQLQKTANTQIYEWSVIRRKVLAHYPAVSYEALLIYLYNEIIARDDFGCLMAYKPSEVKNDDNNYCLIDRQAKTAVLHLNKYKTVGSYQAKVLNLTPQTSALILKLHPDNSQKTLFPPFANNKLGNFIRKTMNAVPFLKNENVNIKYMRHSLISSALARLKPTDPQYAIKLQALAERAFHKVSTQPTYLSPLKDEKGQPFAVNAEITKDFDAITVVQEQGGEPEEGEEVSSKPKTPAKKPINKQVNKPRQPLPPVQEERVQPRSGRVTRERKVPSKPWWVA